MLAHGQWPQYKYSGIKPAHDWRVRHCGRTNTTLNHDNYSQETTSTAHVLLGLGLLEHPIETGYAKAHFTMSEESA